MHRAGWVVVDPWTVIPGGFVRVEAGRVIETGVWSPTRNEAAMDHGPGALMPALINAHTHLELSALAGRLGPFGGFLEWVREVIRQRDAFTTKEMLRAARRAVGQMIDTGSVAVGEVSTLGLTRQLLAGSGLAGVWWREFLGADIPSDLDGTAPTGNGLCFSLAGHGPHSTHPGLLVRLKQRTEGQGRPFAIHLAESAEETQFITTGQGRWADFLAERGIGFDDWGLPAAGPVAWARAWGLLDERTLVVHLLGTGPDDWDLLRQRDVKVCLCPRSNQRLHGRLPDWPGMLDAGLSPALGTDSLASAESLSLWDEMRFSALSFSTIDPSFVLAATTLYAARALGIEDDCGSLRPGRRAALLSAPVSTADPSRVIESLVHGDLGGPINWAAGRPGGKED
ncbi:MAG: amidohydrolase family protein [Proteobacteria bacterium]|nr:amidohydrolase family protein [Pseudomonadota bacterium]MBU1740306.1 amidohydrolase family protein [Pseudomonadota bacterium]